MCGRFALSANSGSIEKLMPDLKSNLDISRFNIAPTQTIHAILNIDPGNLTEVKWGLVPSWSKDDSMSSGMINARSETIFEKPSFRSLIRKKRCLIPASGYFEWKVIHGEKKKSPYYIKLKTGDIFTFAGLWDEWKLPDGNKIKTATIITCQPNEKLTDIHNRMPVIIPGNLREAWLSINLPDKEIENMLEALPDDFIDFFEVSKTVNNPSIDNPDCIIRI